MFVRFIADWAQYQGGEVRDFDKQYADQLIADGKAIYAGARDQNSLSYDPVSGALVDTGGNRLMTLRRPAQTLKSCWMGKYKSVANAADYTTRVFQTLEAHTDRVRVGIINPIAAPLTNVRVSVGTSDTMPADLASLHGSSVTAGQILSNGGLATGAAFTAAAGTSADKPTITWSDWLDISTVDRADGGTLPLVRVSIEIPTSGNANRPACDTTSTRAGWESAGSNDVAPFGRAFKARNGAGLGVTTPSAGSSTVYSDETIPYVLEYMPRHSQGITLTAFGDSIAEGAGATVNGCGFPYIARAAVSNMTRPVEICCMAAASMTMDQMADRAEAVAATLRPELAMVTMFTPNGITAPNFTATSGARLQYKANQRIRSALAGQDCAIVGFSGIPMLAVAPDSTTGSKDLNSASATVLNQFISAALNSAVPVVDAYTPMSGPADADGQVTMLIGTSADGLHPNSAGHALMAGPVAAMLRGVMLA